MRMPEHPPPTSAVIRQLLASAELSSILREGTSPAHKGRYIHWDKLRRIPLSAGLSHEAIWARLKLSRVALYKPLPLKGLSGSPFVYGMPDPIPELLHRIDQAAGGRIEVPELITNPDTRDRYIINSIIEESIRSSQLEGAVTTRRIAKEMLRSARPPRNKSEQMILNNFRTMKRIQSLRREPLSPELIYELHRLVTEHTLTDPTKAGSLRQTDDQVEVVDYYGKVFHTPPDAANLRGRVEQLCRFANGEIPESFLHPVLRSIILHFWLAYDHPFVDGNGRSARALFYWSMLRYDYWLCEYISISHVIRKAPVKYCRAFLYTETDDNDLTYFILYHLDVIDRAIKELNKYLRVKMYAIRQLERRLRDFADLNHRQRAIVGHALRHPDARYSIESHRSSHGVVYETARTDLTGLARLGILQQRKQARTWFFYPAPDLEERIGGAP